jgi:hypothetical protein
MVSVVVVVQFVLLESVGACLLLLPLELVVVADFFVVKHPAFLNYQVSAADDAAFLLLRLSLLFVLLEW